MKEAGRMGKSTDVALSQTNKEIAKRELGKMGLQ